jgi:uncharacterized protein YegP (UPF0339 family)
MGRFELKKASDGQLYFTLNAENGEVILRSELYKARESALNGIESVRKNAPLAERFEFKSSSNQKPYFVLKAGNHEIIGQSEMYESDAARNNGVMSVQSNAPQADLRDLTH